MSLRRLAVAVFGLLALSAAGSAARAAPDDMSLGDPKAKVTVIEYASVTCPHCAKWNAEVFPAFKAKYVDTGKVRYVFREIPTQPGELAIAGFLVARCAGAKYFEVIDALMGDQQTLYRTGDGRSWLMQAGAKAGLSADQVKACVLDKTAQQAFDDRYEANVKELKIDGTPTFFVNGKMLASGELSLDTLDKALQPLLAPTRAAAKPAPGRKPHKR
jgi:protein-disulfide isomerase